VKNAILECNFQVQERCDGTEGVDCPGEFAEGEFILECGEVSKIVGWGRRWVWNPDSKNIVDISGPEFYLWKGGNKLHFVNAVVEGSVGRGRWSAHCCSTELEPICIVELEKIVPHEDSKSVDKCNCVNALEEMVVGRQRDELFYDVEGMCGVDVVIHRNSVGSKDFCGWRQRRKQQ